MLGYTAESLEIGDLPILSFDMRATHLFRKMRNAMRSIKPVVLRWKPKPGSGFQVGIRLFKLNAYLLFLQMGLTAIVAALYYVPIFFLRRLIAYLETDPQRLHREWGVVFALGILVSGVLLSLSRSALSRIIHLFQHLTPLFSNRSGLVHQHHHSPSQITRTA